MNDFIALNRLQVDILEDTTSHNSIDSDLLVLTQLSNDISTELLSFEDNAITLDTYFSAIEDLNNLCSCAKYINPNSMVTILDNINIPDLGDDIDIPDIQNLSDTELAGALEEISGITLKKVIKLVLRIIKFIIDSIIKIYAKIVAYVGSSEKVLKQYSKRLNKLSDKDVDQNKLKEIELGLYKYTDFLVRLSKIISIIDNLDRINLIEYIESNYEEGDAVSIVNVFLHESEQWRLGNINAYVDPTNHTIGRSVPNKQPESMFALGYTGIDRINSIITSTIILSKEDKVLKRITEKQLGEYKKFETTLNDAFRMASSTEEENSLTVSKINATKAFIGVYNLITMHTFKTVKEYITDTINIADVFLTNFER